MQPLDDKFPSAPQAFFVVLALMLAEYLMGALLYDARDTLALTDNQLDALSTLLGNGLIFSILMPLQRLSYRELLHDSQASPARLLLALLPPIVLVLPALVLSLGAVTDWLTTVFPLSSWEERAFEGMSAHNLAAVVATCVLAPVLEEMLFRGVILRGFLQHYPPGLAIAGSAIVFGLAHMNLYQFVVAFVIGGLSGWLYERTRSLLPSIVLHAAYNGSLTAWEWWADAASTASSAPTEAAADVPALIWAVALTAALAGGRWLWRLLGPAQARPN